MPRQGIVSSYSGTCTPLLQLEEKEERNDLTRRVIYCAPLFGSWTIISAFEHHHHDITVRRAVRSFAVNTAEYAVRHSLCACCAVRNSKQCSVDQDDACGCGLAFATILFPFVTTCWYCNINRNPCCHCGENQGIFSIFHFFPLGICHILVLVVAYLQRH